MGRRRVKTDYEELRKAQILENQVLLASHGIQKTIAELRTISGKPQSEKKKHNKIDYSSAPLRRSNRLKGGKSNDNKLRVKKSRAAETTEKAEKPKHPPIAFFIFIEEFRKEYKEKHPSNKSVAVVGKAAGEKWKSFSDAEKAPYQSKAEKVKAEYQKNMLAYSDKQQAGVVDSA